MWTKEQTWLMLLAAPACIVLVAFFVLPLGKLVMVSATGPAGWAVYVQALQEVRYWKSLASTVMLASSVTLVTVCISGIAGVFLARHRFTGHTLLTALLTLPLAFPGVVIGFMVIMLGGRQGLFATIGEHLFGGAVVFAYSLTGLFVGYVYFSIPRTVLTIMAAAEKLDPRIEEAARSLGASPGRVAIDVILPALKPALLACGAICFATAMGAFGTAFTLATKINVLPMVIYSEFTVQANIAMASVLSLFLGFITWLVLAVSRSVAGSGVAAAA
jgi:putative spermidine/putrescine transport system permease protein